VSTYSLADTICEHRKITQPYRKHRQYTPAFKVQLVAKTQSIGASVACITLDDDLNANLLRGWITESKQVDQQPTPAFVPINLPAAATSAVKKSSSMDYHQ